MIKMTRDSLNWIFGFNRQTKRLIQIFFDCLAVPFAFLIAFLMRLETIEFLLKIDTYIGVIISLVSVLFVYAKSGVYNTFTRHISIELTYSIALGAAVSCGALFIGTLLLELQIPRSVPLIFAVILFFCSLTARLFIRALGLSFLQKPHENIAIYGAGAAGIQLFEALRFNEHYLVRFFVDDNPDLNGENLCGVPIYSLALAKEKFTALNIETLLLAVAGSVDVIRHKVYDVLSDHPLKVKTIPNIANLISGESEIIDLKDINIGDLLGRKAVTYDPELMAKNISGKTVFVSGAGGSIGSELCRQIVKWQPNRLIMLDVSEFAIYTIAEQLSAQSPDAKTIITPIVGSIQDRNFITKILDRFKVDTLYHAAAYKHVPLMEQNIMQCISNNVVGTLNIAEVAIAYGVSNFILVSTDKAVNPTNFMGASKRAAEIICKCFAKQQKGTCFTIVRFGNVLGSSGSVVPLFKKQIDAGGPMTVTHPDITRYFMTLPEAAHLVIQAGSLSVGGEIFVLDMGEPVKIVDLARKMATLSGLKPIFNATGPISKDEIEVNISGLRPGEKLFEELSYGGCLIGTSHPQINKAIEEPNDYLAVQKALSSLQTAIYENDHESAKNNLKFFIETKDLLDESRDIFLTPTPT